MLSPILVVSVFIVLLVWAWRFLNWVWFQPKKMEKILRKQGFEGNSYRFLFGDAKEISIMYKEAYSKPIGFNDDILPRVMPFIAKTIKKYGEKSFMWVGPRPLIFILDAELMKVVMNKHTNFQKAFKISNPLVKSLIGGLIRFEGEEWNKSRKKLNPAFHLDKLKEMVPTIQLCCEEILDKWKDRVATDGSSEVDVFDYLPDFTGSVVSRTLFSSNFDDKVKRTFLILSELSDLSNQAQPFSIPGEQYLPTKKNKRAKEIEKEVKIIFTYEINKRVMERKTGLRDGELDLFDIFMEELYDKNIASDRTMIIDEIIAQCKLFYLAGYETTSNLIAWTIVMLSIHQDWQARAREEVFRVLGNKNKLLPDDLSQLKNLNMIVHEVLRLYPSSVEVTRVVEEETRVGDFCLPKGTMVMLPVVQLHRNPKIWGEDVKDFKPERFAEGVLKAANGQAAFIPFGWGPRNCIGANMALWQAKIFISMFLQNFSFELSPTYAHGPFVALNMQPQFGVPLLLHKL